MSLLRLSAGLLIAATVACCAATQRHAVTDTRTADFCGHAPDRAGTWAWVNAHEKEVRAYDPSLPPTGVVVGLLIDYAGRPIQGGRVALKAGAVAPGDTILRSVVAADGIFRFDSLGQRDYILDVRRLGYERQWHAYRSVRGLTDTLCIPLHAWPVILEEQTTGAS